VSHATCRTYTSDTAQFTILNVSQRYYYYYYYYCHALVWWSRFTVDCPHRTNPTYIRLSYATNRQVCDLMFVIFIWHVFPNTIKHDKSFEMNVCQLVDKLLTYQTGVYDNLNCTGKRSVVWPMCACERRLIVTYLDSLMTRFNDMDAGSLPPQLLEIGRDQSVGSGAKFNKPQTFWASNAENGNTVKLSITPESNRPDWSYRAIASIGNENSYKQCIGRQTMRDKFYPSFPHRRKLFIVMLRCFK